MNARLRQIWSTLSPGARATCLAALFISAAVIYIALVYSAEQSRSRLKSGISELRVRSAAMERQGSEISRLRAKGSATNTAGTDLPKTVQALAESNGLSIAAARISSRDDEHVEVAISNLPFTQWLSMARALQAQQIRIESCKIEGLAAQGMVNVTATLNRPRTR